MPVKFYIEKRTNKHGEALVRCSVSIQGKRLLTTTGFTVDPFFWDQASQRVVASSDKKGTINAKGMTAKLLNARLKRIDSFFSDLENSLWMNHETVGNLRRIYRKEFGRTSALDKSEADSQPSFFDVLDDFREEQSQQNGWSEATRKKFQTLRNHLEAFKGNLEFSDLDERGLAKFTFFLQEERSLRNSSVVKTLNLLKWFLRWAVAHGHTNETAFLQYAPKLRQTEKKVIFLTWDELMKVYSFKFPEIGTIVELTDSYGNKYEKEVIVGRKTMERVRDIFCFCCLTSLRFSDAQNLKKLDIYSDYINVTTIKTADTLKIELNKYARNILEKYKDQSLPYNRALPIMSNQRMNEYLKHLGEICGLNDPITVTYYRGEKRIDETWEKWQLLGSHAGRRTFICNALMLGISPQIVMKWTGHSDYKAMKPYIDIADKAKSDAMSLFDQV